MKTETRKIIDLDNEVIKVLQIQAIKSGHKNFKRYAEHILRVQSQSNHLNIPMEVTNG